MIIIRHRVNTLAELKEVKEGQGAEIDLRYHEDEIILHHDPLGHHRVKSFLFKDFLSSWNSKGPLILNIKTEGIENLCIEFMNNFKISNWFFLDLSMPYFVKFTDKAFNQEIQGFSSYNLAARFSEREPLEYAISFMGKANWIWVDCFSYLPLDLDILDDFAGYGLADLGKP